MSTITIGFLVYLITVLVIGFWASHRNTSNEDYLLGGKRLNGWFLAFSERASGESAWLLLGLPAAALVTGYGESWTAIGCPLGILFSWKFIAAKLQLETTKSNALTLPQYLSFKFANCRIILALGALISIFFYTFYVASGVDAAGKVLNMTFGVDKQQGMYVGTAVVLVYTIVGGFAAVVLTDVLQAILMVAALVILPAVGIYKLGGPSQFLSQLGEIQDPAFSSWTNGMEGMAGLIFVLGGLSWGFGYLGQPHLLTRFMAMPDTKEVKKGFVVAICWVVPAFIGAMLIGLVAKVAFSPEFLLDQGVALDGPSKEKLMPFFAQYFLPAWLAGILICAAIAAMMSTADTQLLVCTSALCEDLYRCCFGNEPGDKTLLIISRVFTALICVIALFIALMGKESIMSMVSYAWGGLGSSFGPVVVLSLYWKKLTRQGVIFGLLFGSIGTVFWRNSFLQTIAPERFSIFVINLLLIIVVSYLMRRRQESKRN